MILSDGWVFYSGMGFFYPGFLPGFGNLVFFARLNSCPFHVGNQSTNERAPNEISLPLDFDFSHPEKPVRIFFHVKPGIFRDPGSFRSFFAERGLLIFSDWLRNLAPGEIRPKSLRTKFSTPPIFSHFSKFYRTFHTSIPSGLYLFDLFTNESK